MLGWTAGTHVQGPRRDRPPERDPGEQPRRVDPPVDAGRIRAQVVADGDALSYRQEPPLVFAREDHGARLAEFIVSGDVAEVQFDRWNGESYQAETWRRERTATVAGRLVSIFEPAWPAEVVQERRGRSRVGLDRPFFYLGEFRGPSASPSVSRSIYLRAGLSLARPVEVVRIDETAQYASHIVNLVVPGFGDTRLTSDFDLEAVGRRFYEHFEDSYQVLAIVPEAPHVTDYAAFHRTVQNEVLGTGRAPVRRFAAYGSGGSLIGVQMYSDVWLPSNEVSNHELTHIWSHSFDWGRIANLTRPPDVGAHAPLMTGGESMVSAVLYPARRVARRADGTAVVERVTSAARQHPLELYAMGLIGPADVPEWEVFEQQDQFADDETPSPGTEVTGAARRVSINDIMAAHGARSGPVLSSLSRATVVVSRDRLLSAEEMAYWNYFSARLEDPTGSGIPSYDLQPSFEATVGRRIDLLTDVRPKSHPRLGQPHDVDPPLFGTSDCRDFTFTQPPRARLRAGERFTVTGQVTARDRNDFHQVLVRLWPGNGDSSRAVLEYREIGRSGGFSTDLEVREGREGQYLVDLFLFWPSAGPQSARCTLSPLTVSPAR